MISKIHPIFRAKKYFKVGATNECWEWTGDKTKAGYSRLWVDGRTVNAHRFLYLFLTGKDGGGLFIDHLCRNKICVNPYHLELVTPKENTFRGDSYFHWTRKTHCVRGHEYKGENLKIRKNGSRACRACYREHFNTKLVRKRKIDALSKSKVNKRDFRETIKLAE